MKYRDYLNEAIVVGKSVKIMAATNHGMTREPVEVKITDYKKKISGDDMVYYRDKRGVQKLAVSVFKARMKEAARK